MTTPKHRTLPLSRAWINDDVPLGATEALDTAFKSLMRDPAWQSWIDSNVPTLDKEPRRFHVLQVEDRDKRRIVVRGIAMSVYEPAENIIRAHDEGRIEQHYLEMFQAMYTRWADRRDLPPPPPIPDPRS